MFAFLTCEANAVVAPIHPKAMPVILTTPEECHAWMTGPPDEALRLQRPLKASLLSVVARGPDPVAWYDANATSVAASYEAMSRERLHG